MVYFCHGDGSHPGVENVLRLEHSSRLQDGYTLAWWLSYSETSKLLLLCSFRFAKTAQISRVKRNTLMVQITVTMEPPPIKLKRAKTSPLAHQLWD